MCTYLQLLLLLLYLLGILKWWDLPGRGTFFIYQESQDEEEEEEDGREIILPYISYSKFGGEMS